MVNLSLTDEQAQFLVDSQNTEIHKLTEKLNNEYYISLALKDYIISLGKEHILKCVELMHSEIEDKSNFVRGAMYWHDEYVDLSCLNNLAENGKLYFTPWED